jgi:hypothetical protein
MQWTTLRGDETLDRKAELQSRIFELRQAAHAFSGLRLVRQFAVNDETGSEEGRAHAGIGEKSLCNRPCAFSVPNMVYSLPESC